MKIVVVIFCFSGVVYIYMLVELFELLVKKFGIEIKVEI